jgi:hypothetical protein
LSSFFVCRQAVYCWLLLVTVVLFILIPFLFAEIHSPSPSQTALWRQIRLCLSPNATPFLLLQQTAVQSSILILSHTVNRILQTSSVVKNSAATIQTDMAVSDSDA